MGRNHKIISRKIAAVSGSLWEGTFSCPLDDNISRLLFNFNIYRRNNVFCLTFNVFPSFLYWIYFIPSTLNRSQLTQMKRNFLKEYWIPCNIKIEQCDLSWNWGILEMQVTWINGEFLEAAAVRTTELWLSSGKSVDCLRLCEEGYSLGKTLWRRGGMFLQKATIHKNSRQLALAR